jgi:hypothetical protein
MHHYEKPRPDPVHAYGNHRLWDKPAPPRLISSSSLHRAMRPFARLISSSGDSVTPYGEPWNMN